MSFPYSAKTLEVRICFHKVGRLVTLSRVQKPHEHGPSDSKAQMFDKKWLDFIGLCVLIYLIFCLIRLYLALEEWHELRQALERELGESRTRQDILSEYKNNSGHELLPRSERRFRNVQLERYLKRSRRQQRSRFIGYHTKGKGPEPIENPAVEKFSRRQLTFPSSRAAQSLVPFRTDNTSPFMRCVYTQLYPFLLSPFFVKAFGLI